MLLAVALPGTRGGYGFLAGVKFNNELPLDPVVFKFAKVIIVHINGRVARLRDPKLARFHVQIDTSATANFIHAKNFSARHQFVDDPRP